MKIDTLCEKLTEYIKIQIITGKFPPGERINELALASQLEVSTASLREALSGINFFGGLGKHFLAPMKKLSLFYCEVEGILMLDENDRLRKEVHGTISLVCENDIALGSHRNRRNKRQSCLNIFGSEIAGWLYS